MTLLRVGCKTSEALFRIPEGNSGRRMYVSPDEYERYMNSVVDATGDDPAGNVEHFLFPDFPDTLDILSS